MIVNRTAYEYCWIGVGATTSLHERAAQGWRVVPGIMRPDLLMEREILTVGQAEDGSGKKSAELAAGDLRSMSGSEVLGYVVVVREKDGTLVLDWDGVLHPTREAAEDEMSQARDACYDAYTARVCGWLPKGCTVLSRPRPAKGGRGVSASARYERRQAPIHKAVLADDDGRTLVAESRTDEHTMLTWTAPSWAAQFVVPNWVLADWLDYVKRMIDGID